MDTETTEARYLRASRTAHRAWLVTQPQFVIPGLLDALDAAPQSVAVSTAVRAGGSFERVPLTDGGEPYDRTDLPPEARFVGTRDDRAVVPANSTNNEDGRTPAEGMRGRPQKGA